eukprot:1955527-Ditylum_brightwellii.AAC.1
MMFYCPHTQRVYTTATYCLDEPGHTAIAFNLSYDGGILLGLYSSSLSSPSVSDPVPEPYPPGNEVHYTHRDGIYIQNTVVSDPKTTLSLALMDNQNPTYTVCLVEYSNVQVSSTVMDTITKVPSSPPLSCSQAFALPNWIGYNKKVTFELKWKHEICTLILKNCHWKCAHHQSDEAVDKPNLGLTYQHLLKNKLLLPGWNSSFIPAAVAAHVITQ